MNDEPGWVLAERESEDGIHLVRVSDVGIAFKFSSFPERLSVIWEYREQDSSNAPSESDSEAMERFENQLMEQIEKSGHSYLMIVFTEPTNREWVFYSSSAKKFLKALNQVPQDDDPFPISIHHESDEQGAFYKSYAAKLLKPG